MIPSDTMIPATSRAATESAQLRPRRTPINPANTPSVASTSDSRFVASARSASLEANRPTRRSTAARPASITSAAISSAKA